MVVVGFTIDLDRLLETSRESFIVGRLEDTTDGLNDANNTWKWRLRQRVLKEWELDTPKYGGEIVSCTAMRFSSFTVKCNNPSNYPQLFRKTNRDKIISIYLFGLISAWWNGEKIETTLAQHYWV